MHLLLSQSGKLISQGLYYFTQKYIGWRASGTFSDSLVKQTI